MNDRLFSAHLAAYMLLLCLGVTNVFSATITVTSLADSGSGTLREAITIANSNNGDNTINFSSAFAGQTILLTSGGLMLSQNVTIDASSLTNGISISGNQQYTVILVSNEATNAVLNALTITGANGNNSGVYNSGGTLTLNNCRVCGNSANNANGGGIYNDGGTLMLNSCMVSKNSSENADYGGGGIYNDGVAILNSCTVSGNSAPNGYGGGICNNGRMTLNSCTVSGNSANNADGGGIYNNSALTLNSCTVSGNSANNEYVEYVEYGGGGIYNDGGTLTLNSCTVSANSALNGYGGGINNVSTVNLTNTIVGGCNVSIGGADIYNGATLTYGGSNLVSAVADDGSINGSAPLTNAPAFAPLGNYGGLMQTMPLLPGSPALGTGSVAANIFTNDQRGFARSSGNVLDLGAVQIQRGVATTEPATSITTGSATLNGNLTLNDPALLWYFSSVTNDVSWFQFSTNMAYGSFSSTNSDVIFTLNSNTVSISQRLTGLTAGTVYDYQLFANGVASHTTDSTFTTLILSVIDQITFTTTNRSEAVTLNITGPANASYTVQRTTNLPAGPWLPIAGISAGTNGQLQYIDYPSTDNGFYRLLVN